MANLLEHVAHIASILVGPSVLAVTAASFGALPRAGPLRALVLGASTKLPFLRPAYTASQRVGERVALAAAVETQSTHEYIIVTGPKGIGKTHLINTVMAGQPGVLFVPVSPGQTEDEIAANALNAVAGYEVSWLDVYTGAERVIKWHKRWFGVPPTVVLRVYERAPTTKAADVGGAIRQLATWYGLHVIVDCSDTTLGYMARQTLLHRWEVQVEPMERAQLRDMPELKDLHEALETAGVADLVWEVIGGNPASYEQLRTDWVEAQLLGRNDIVKVAEDLCRDYLWTATRELNYVVARNPALEEAVYARFKTVDFLPADIRKQHVLPSPDEVLRLVEKDGDEEAVLKPATPAMALVLRHSVDGRTPPLEAVRKVVAARTAGTGSSAAAVPQLR